MTNPILPTDITDLPMIIEMFEQSIRYQERKGYPVWKNYDKGTIIDDIGARHQFKILVEGKIAMVFSIAYHDKIIWRAMDTGESIYLHRIVVNPAFKGRKLFDDVLQWTKQHAKDTGRKSVRMDTWANNPNIIEYYKTFGFAVIENFTTPDIPDLPAHNRNLSITLLELKQ